MMKNAVLGVVLLNFLFLLACTRVQVEILQPAGETETRTPKGGEKLGGSELEEIQPSKRRPEGAALGSNFIVLTQTGGKPCAADRSVTRPVAQQTGVWCWAASAEGVTSFHKVDLPQCLAVNKVKAGDQKTEEGDPFCCKNMLDGKCQQNGWTDEVFDSFGIDYRWWPGPLSERQIAGQICGNGPFTYSIAYEGGGGHTFVVKDYSVDEKGMSLWVDTHEYFTNTEGKRFPAGFKEYPFKEYVEGWYDGLPHKVDFTYVLIKPQD